MLFNAMDHRHNSGVTSTCMVALQTTTTACHLALIRVRLVRTKGPTIRVDGRVAGLPSEPS